MIIALLFCVLLIVYVAIWRSEAMLSVLLNAMENNMSAISDFAAKQNAFNDRMDTAIADLQGDIKSLNDQIAALQGTPGTITPQDQALLDALQARAQTAADKLDALDALTPPTPPTP